MVPNRFSLTDPAPRRLNKAALQAEMGFPQNPAVPLIAFIGRMDPQKGIDLALDALRLCQDVPWQAIILGTGDPGLQDATVRLAADYPDRVRAAILFDNALSRRIYAGSDAILVPSRYEPCGLVQMNAMRYGCIPVARSTGGLRDTITDYPDPGSTGFLFEAPVPQALSDTLHRALAVFPKRKIWTAIQSRGMAQDFSWHKSALLYARLYQQMIS
jgi:starch synthase